jgi:acetate CoA/acetoacetate CoA-transferase alpha subunit
VLTPTGVGTVVEEGKRKLEVDGREYLLETALHADFALVEAFLADYLGNLTYVLTARNFTVSRWRGRRRSRAEHVVPVGMISPDHVMRRRHRRLPVTGSTMTLRRSSPSASHASWPTACS